MQIMGAKNYLRTMNKNKIQVWLPLLLSLAMSAGIYLGYQMRGNMPGKRFFSIDKSRPVQEVMDLIHNNYVDDVMMNALSDTAINAVLNKLDPHSVFIPAEELQGINEDIKGNFSGIGVEFNIEHDTLNVTNLVPNGPSFKAGIQIGDQIIKVGDSIIAGRKVSTDKIRKMLHGEFDSKVVLGIQRDHKLIPVTVTRGIIEVSSVDAGYMVNNEIGYIRLNRFSEATYREFKRTLEKLQGQGLKKLILDLRGNGGGVLDEAAAIADEFLEGDKLITYTEGKHFPKKEYRCKTPGLFEKGPLVVLADEGTASASEILLGALQDWDRATIIGRRSFGKGLVQQQFDLSDGSALRLTIARYYTPIGRSIQRPYNKGEKEYFNEINQRFHDGEVISADSVKNDTTKIYKTMNGKKVYGGGGISPDYFIPYDTSDIGTESSKIYVKGLTGDYAFKYYMQSKEQLKNYKTPADFKNGFTFTDELWNSFSDFVKKDSIDLSHISVKEKDGLVKHITAQIARQLWRSEGYFEIINREDDAIKKGIEVLSK